jgi:AAA lid domain
VYVPEPTVDETYQILLGLRERYEAHHKLRYTDEALDAAAKYSHQYISDRWPLTRLLLSWLGKCVPATRPALSKRAPTFVAASRDHLRQLLQR